MTSPIPKSKLGSSSSEMDACIVCEVLDERVSRCCGADCVVWFHGECMVKCGVSDDLSSSYCPCCWLKLVTLKSKSLREEANQAHKALLQYQETALVDTCVDFSRVVLNDSESVDMEQDVEQVLQKGDVSRLSSLQESGQVLEKEKQSGKRRRVASGEQKRLSIQDVEDDDETELYSGEEDDLVQQHENQSGGSSRRRQVVISDDDSDDEISSSEEQDVTEPNNQPTREASFVKKGHRRRILWTPEEEEMLKKGVEKFEAESRRNTPWQKILIWGADVFNKDREPSNLKDKWKNMLKNEQKEQDEL